MHALQKMHDANYYTAIWDLMTKKIFFSQMMFRMMKMLQMDYPQVPLKEACNCEMVVHAVHIQLQSNHQIWNERVKGCRDFEKSYIDGKLCFELQRFQLNQNVQMYTIMYTNVSVIHMCAACSPWQNGDA